MDIKRTILFRTYLVGALIFMAFFAIIFKTAYIQLAEGPKWRDLGKEKYYDIRKIEAERGNVYDSKGNVIVGTIPRYEIRADFNTPYISDELFDQNIDSLAFYLSDFSKGQYSRTYYLNYIRKARVSGNRYCFIAKDIDYQQMETLMKFPLFRLGKNKGGLIINPDHKRIKPFGDNGSRTIGYVQGERKIGIEGAFDQYLRGEVGYRLMKRLPGDIWIPVQDMNDVDPESGKDIVTTLDMMLQDITHNALLKTLTKHEAHHGTAIVMEVSTGKIRAISNLGKTNNGQYQEIYNYAIAESAEPGSTFKLPVLMALMEDYKLSLDDTVFVSKGKMEFYDRTMVDAHEHEDDFLNIRQIFEQSSNVGMARLTQKHYTKNQEQHKFIERLQSFGILDTLGFDVHGESKPIYKIPGEKEWYGTTLPWMSIGYESKLSPVQILSFYNAVANDGKLMKPYLVESIANFGKTEISYEPVVLKNKIASNETLAKLQELLIGVIEQGTASIIKSNKYLIAGKTGTAQINYNKDQVTQNEKKQQYQASFAGYFPADKPLYSVIVVVNDPQINGVYGSQVAAPVFKEIAHYCYSVSTPIHASINEQYLQDSKAKYPSSFKGHNDDIKKIESLFSFNSVNNASNWAYGQTINDTVKVEPLLDIEKKVPDVRGMGLRDALFILENRGLKVKVSGVGKVVNQSIPPGSPLNLKEITIKLG